MERILGNAHLYRPLQRKDSLEREQGVWRGRQSSRRLWDHWLQGSRGEEGRRGHWGRQRASTITGGPFPLDTASIWMVQLSPVMYDWTVGLHV